jgi:hypothetical protein
MLDVNRLMMRAGGGALGAAQRFLELFGEPVSIHNSFAASAFKANHCQRSRKRPVAGAPRRKFR